MKNYKVVSGENLPYYYNKLQIHSDAGKGRVKIEMFIKCKTLEKAYDKFAKAYNEAVADGLLGGHFETLAEWKENVKGEWTLAEDGMWGAWTEGGKYSEVVGAMGYDDMEDVFYIFYNDSTEAIEEARKAAESVEVETVVFKPVLHIGIEEMMKIPVSELRKATDYNFWQNKIMEYEKEMASLKDGSALKESYEKTLEYYKDELAKARKALYSVENGVEDDGSNDDDYDEEEITVYTPAVDDDDDDELIDPPEEVKVEKENAASVIEIPKEIEMAVELVPFAIERFNEGKVESAPVQFEVGKIYYSTSIFFEKNYTAIEIVKRTKKFVTFVEYYENGETDYDETTRARIETDNPKGEYISVRDCIGGYTNTYSWHTEPPKFSKKKNCYYFEDAPYIGNITEYADDEEVIAEVQESTAADVDTAVTEVPIDSTYAEIEDEIKCKLEAIEGLKLEVEKLREQLKALKKKDAPVDKDAENFKKLNDEIENCNTQIEIWQGMRVEKEQELNKTLREIEHWAYKKMSEVEGKGCIRIRHQTKSRFVVIDKVGDCWDDLEFSAFNDIFKICRYTTYATYTSVEKFKAAIEGLAAAIERGDEEFAFPNEKA